MRDNVYAYLTCLRNVRSRRIMEFLEEKPRMFTEILEHNFPRTEKVITNSGLLSYSMKELKQNYMVFSKNGLWHLTFKGQKTMKLLRIVEKLSNIDMSHPENAKARVYVDLDNSESWLRPMLKIEIRNAVLDLKKLS